MCQILWHFNIYKKGEGEELAMEYLIHLNLHLRQSVLTKIKLNKC